MIISVILNDTAVFFMDLEKKDVFAISTERITRFKHDKVFPIPALDKYLEYSRIDAAAVTRIVCGNPKLMQKSRRYRMNAFEREMYFRTIIGEKYLKGFKAGMNKFNNKSSFVRNLFLLSKGQYRKYRNIEKSVETGFQIQILQVTTSLLSLGLIHQIPTQRRQWTENYKVWKCFQLYLD